MYLNYRISKSMLFFVRKIRTNLSHSLSSDLSILNVLYEKKSIEEKFELWENFSLNSQFAFTQMVQLTSTDLAFFGDREVEKTNKENSDFSYNGDYYKIISDTALDKFQKRNKDFHRSSPSGFQTCQQ